MSIPLPLLDAARAHVQAGRRVGILVRHAERFAVKNLANHEEVLLTPRGHAQAEAGGTHLATLAKLIRLVHSPVERCAETARALVVGACAQGVDAAIAQLEPLLYAPFIRDRRRAWEIVMGTGPSFIREWFDGRLPPEVFQPRREAAGDQLDVIAGHLDRAAGDALTVFVSHDWNIALLREDVLGITPERSWPDFLDGLVVAVDGDELVVEHAGRAARRPRSGLGA